MSGTRNFARSSSGWKAGGIVQNAAAGAGKSAKRPAHRAGNMARGARLGARVYLILCVSFTRPVWSRSAV